MSYLKKAHEFAINAHGAQKRKFIDVDYIIHLEETAQLLWETTNGEASYEEYVAALLHDTVEDTEVTLRDIGRNFGKVVMDLVSELTIDEDEKNMEGKKSYLVRVINNMTEKAFTIKLCDRFNNVAGLTDKRIPKDFVKWYVKETQYILEHLDREITEAQAYMLNRIEKMLILLRLERGL